MTPDQYRKKILEEILDVGLPQNSLSVIEKAQRVLDSSNVTSEVKARFWVGLYVDLEERLLDIEKDDFEEEEAEKSDDDGYEIAYEDRSLNESQSTDALAAIIRFAKSAIAKRTRS